jgi:hypothetical protein
MITLFQDFVKKYELDDFKKKLELNGTNKIEFYTELNTIMEKICRIFDKLTNIASLRGGQVMMSLAKLTTADSVINKTDIKNSLNIDRLDKLWHAFDYLEKENYISIEKKTSKFHIIKLNEEDNPDLTLFKEIVQNYWETPEEIKEKAKGWRLEE